LRLDLRARERAVRVEASTRIYRSLHESRERGEREVTGGLWQDDDVRTRRRTGPSPRGEGDGAGEEGRGGAARGRGRAESKREG
jgi:hypothetical protein